MVAYKKATNLLSWCKNKGKSAAENRPTVKESLSHWKLCAGEDQQISGWKRGFLPCIGRIEPALQFETELEVSSTPGQSSRPLLRRNRRLRGHQA